MNILALDLGTRTGWALREDGRIESGAQSFVVGRGESPGMRYIRFNRWLEQLSTSGRPLTETYSPRIRVIAYEQAHQRGGAATELAYGFATRVQEFAARYGIEHIAVHSTTLKKWTTGHGNAGKGEMLRSVNRRWAPNANPTWITNDDEADAYALLQHAIATWGE